MITNSLSTSLLSCFECDSLAKKGKHLFKLKLTVIDSIIYLFSKFLEILQ